MRTKFFLAILTSLALSSMALAQEEGEVEVGRGAAQKYFQKRKAAKKNAVEGGGESRNDSGANSLNQPRHLTIHFGTFLDDRAYAWGSSEESKNIGLWDFGVGYRLGYWVNSMDLKLKLDLIQYELSRDPMKLGAQLMVTFPDVASGFPLYFGGGLGIGAFFKQVKEESFLSFDYSLVAGARLANVVGSTGVFVEFGVNNHFHILSDGQFNGFFGSAGLSFNF